MIKPKELLEEKAKLFVYEQEQASRDVPVFYNPVMKHNRDISVLMLQTEKRALQCCDLLAGNGVRSIRLLQETTTIKHVTINDYDTRATELIQKHLENNKISFALQDQEDLQQKERPRVTLTNLEGTKLLLASSGFDYIDIDPFGSPNEFLDAACKRIARNGILAVTMTDTSAPAGSYPDACMRKYWAVPCEGLRKHEVGLRIVIRKIQLVAAQYDKALEPILCYNKDHYYRFYFRCVKGKQKTNYILSQHGVWNQEPDCGPLWLGLLAEPERVQELIEQTADESIKDWLSIIVSENSLEQPGYYHHMNEVQKVLGSTKKEELIEQFPQDITQSHYEGNAIRSNKTLEEIKKAR